MQSELEHLAIYFSTLLADLSDETAFSKTVNHEITDAPAFGRAQSLVILKCDAEGLFLSSTFDKCWEVTPDGTFAVPDCNPFKNCPELPGGGCDIAEDVSPILKFNCDGKSVRLGMRLGANWYVVKEGPLDGAGLPDATRLETF